MLDEIRKGLLSGFGAVLLTKEKAEKLRRKLMKDAKMSREDAQKFMDELFETGSKQWSEIEASISRAIRKGKDNLNFASKKELHGLRSKVGKLEKRIEALEKQAEGKEEI